MTVKAIRFENFMAFADTGWLELRPITLLFGRNSSGKSVVIRALRLLKQSLDHLSEKNPLVFVTEDGVDLGSFKATVHQQALKEPITFHFRCDLSQARTKVLDALRDRINHRRVMDGYQSIPSESAPKELDVSLSYAWDHEKQLVVPIAVQVECPWEIISDLAVCRRTQIMYISIRIYRHCA